MWGFFVGGGLGSEGNFGVFLVHVLCEPSVYPHVIVVDEVSATHVRFSVNAKGSVITILGEVVANVEGDIKVAAIAGFDYL